MVIMNTPLLALFLFCNTPGFWVWVVLSAIGWVGLALGLSVPAVLATIALLLLALLLWHWFSAYAPQRPDRPKP